MILEAIGSEIQKIIQPEVAIRPLSEHQEIICLQYIRENLAREINKNNIIIKRKFVLVEHRNSHQSDIAFRYCSVYGSEAVHYHNKLVNIADPNNELSLSIELVKQWFSDWSDHLATYIAAENEYQEGWNHQIAIQR